MDFDQILEKVGGWGRYQWFLYIIIGLAGMHPGMHNLAGVFTSGLPDHACHVPGAPADLSISELKRIGSPLVSDTSNKYDVCRVYNLNFTSVYSAENRTFNNSGIDILTSQCDQWIYDPSVYETSIVTRVSSLRSVIPHPTYLILSKTQYSTESNL